MPSTATHVWRPSTARVVVIDTFVPAPRGDLIGPALTPAWPRKDPADVLDYVLDFSPAFFGNDGDSIIGIDVYLDPAQPGDLKLDRVSADGTSAILWLSGGLPGTNYTVTVSVTANSGRTLNRSVFLAVENIATAPVADRAILVETGAALTDQNGSPVLAP